MTTIPPNLISISLPKLFFFLLTIAGTIIISNIISLTVSRLIKRKVSKNINRIIKKLCFYVLLFLGVYFSITKIINLNIPAVLTALGVFGAFCFVPTIPILQNAISGIVLIFIRPFSEGDYVDISGEVCEVVDKQILKTKLKSTNGRIVLIPNINLINGNIINYTQGQFIKLSADLSFKKYSDLDNITKIILDICEKMQCILNNTQKGSNSRIYKYIHAENETTELTPKINIKSIGSDKVGLEINFWTNDITRKDEILSAFYIKIKEQLSINAIDLA